CTSTIGSFTGTPATTDSVVVCTCPSRTGATSVDVPPMSKVSRSASPDRPATQAAPTTPPAGPDSRQPAACEAANPISATPPEDCMTTGAGSPCPATWVLRLCRYRDSRGVRYASQTVVEHRSYSRNSGSTSQESDTCT